MEVIREIAEAYYERASQEDFNLAMQFYSKLDVNGDGKVWRRDLKTHNVSYWPWLSNENVFKQLDKDGDGALDLDDVLVLYYIVNKADLVFCSGCYGLLAGPYFSCLLCLQPKGSDTFNLCCNCYRAGTVAHEHFPEYLLDHHSLLSLLRRRSDEAAEKSKGNKVVQRFEELFAQRKYKEAAELAAESPQGILRTLDTVAKFQSVPVQAGQRVQPLLQYFGALLTKGKLNAFESLELSRIVVNQKYGKNLLENWLAEDKLECSEELGDLVKTVDNDIALKIYIKARATPKVVATLAECREFDKILIYSKQKEIVSPEKKRKEIEELGEIAKAYYQAGSKEVRALADEFFKSLDTDKDGRVDISEFLAHMRQEGYAKLQNNYFFKELDSDGNGTLDFWEVMTLYYIIKSGRPFCDCCGNLITGIFFSCVECYMKSESPFSVCICCYTSGTYKHNHDGKAQFLDNYALLEAQKVSALAQATDVQQNQPNVVNPPGPVASSSNAIVPVSNKTNKLIVALNILQPAIGIGVHVATAAASLAGCTIL